MKNNITELVFILDRSGSMAGLESDTIGGFNAMLEKQKKQEGACYVSTVLFSNGSRVLQGLPRGRLHGPARRHRRRCPPHLQPPQVRQA